MDKAIGKPVRLSRPMFDDSALAATNTNVIGTNTLVITTFIKLIDKLLSHRTLVEYALLRRGASNSHTAKTANTTKNILTRITASSSRNKLNNRILHILITLIEINKKAIQKYL